MWSVCLRFNVSLLLHEYIYICMSVLGSMFHYGYMNMYIYGMSVLGSLFHYGYMDMSIYGMYVYGSMLHYD